MNRITNEKIIEFAWVEFKVEISKLPAVGSGIFRSALNSALLSVQKEYPKIEFLDIQYENGGLIFMVFES